MFCIYEISAIILFDTKHNGGYMAFAEQVARVSDVCGEAYPVDWIMDRLVLATNGLRRLVHPETAPPEVRIVTGDSAVETITTTLRSSDDKEGLAAAQAEAERLNAEAAAQAQEAERQAAQAKIDKVAEYQTEIDKAQGS